MPFSRRRLLGQVGPSWRPIKLWAGSGSFQSVSSAFEMMRLIGSLFVTFLLLFLSLKQLVDESGIEMNSIRYSGILMGDN
jgi:hypothetical protein